MSTQPTERDCATALSIAALLKVEMEPWQEVVLKHMLAGHRQPDPSAAIERLERGPYGTCDEPYPQFPSASCKRARGHTGFHEAVPGPSARSVRWETKPECRAVWDNTDLQNVIRCSKPYGHPGSHATALGEEWNDDARQPVTPRSD